MNAARSDVGSVPQVDINRSLASWLELTTSGPSPITLDIVKSIVHHSE